MTDATLNGTQCERCGESYERRPGCDPTSHCDPFAHLTVEELRAAWDDDAERVMLDLQQECIAFRRALQEVCDWAGTLVKSSAVNRGRDLLASGRP